MKKLTASDSRRRSHEIQVEGRQVAITVRRSRRARRLALKVSSSGAGVELVLPWRAGLARGLRFAESQADWIARRLADLPAPVRLADGQSVPFRGVQHRIRHRPNGPGQVRVEANEIHVAGDAEDLPLRLTNWLKGEARRELEAQARAYAAELGAEFRGLVVRDTRTRWGSCSAAGRLSFCWRLIMAPGWVLDYVVAHEVAHLVELNHGPRFWRLVARLGPDRHRARQWLKANGPRLQAVVAV